MLLVVAVLASQLACQEPFGTDRHYLAGDRIAAILVDRPSSTTLQPRAVLVQGDKLWNETAPDLSWAWLRDDAEDADDLDLDSAATDPSPVLELPTFPATLGLVARFDSGVERRAILQMDAAPEPLPAPVAIEVATLDLHPLEATEEELDRDARLANDAEPSVDLSTDTWARLALSWTERPAAFTRTRWSATPAFGTFLELDDTRTDWSPAILEIDELEIEEATPIPGGVITFMVLALDDAAGTRATARDVWVGEQAPTGIRVGQRWMGTDVATSSSQVRGTLEADDDAPTGLRLVSVTEATALPDTDPWGTESLNCLEAVSGPFQPDWLLDGRCPRSAVVGSTVVVEVGP